MDNCIAYILSRVGYHLDTICYFRVYFSDRKKVTWANIAKVIQSHKRPGHLGKTVLGNKMISLRYLGYISEGQDKTWGGHWGYYDAPGQSIRMPSVSSRDEAAGRVGGSAEPAVWTHTSTQPRRTSTCGTIARRRVPTEVPPRTLCCLRLQGSFHTSTSPKEDAQDARLTAPSPACEDEVA